MMRARFIVSQPCSRSAGTEPRGRGQVGGQVSGDRGKLRVGAAGERLAYPHVELVLVEHAPHEGGGEHADGAVPVGVRGPQATAVTRARDLVVICLSHCRLTP